MPAKHGGEPRFELRALTLELPLDLPPVNLDDEQEPDLEDDGPILVSATDPVQVSLL